MSHHSCGLALAVVMLIGVRLGADERGGCVAGEGFPGLDIAVRDYVDLPRGLLGRAQEKVKRVYRSIPIETTWRYARLALRSPVPSALLAPPDAQGIGIHLLIVSPAMAAQLPFAGDVLGATPRSSELPGRLAYVFYHRIAALARSRAVDEALVLGYVIAHEIGHMLLPPHPHTEEGIMRQTLDSRLLGTVVHENPSFSAAEVASIQSIQRIEACD